MKNRMTVAITSLLVASVGAAAFAQGTQQTPPQQPPPQQMPPQQMPPQQMPPQQMPPQQMPPQQQLPPQQQQMPPMTSTQGSGNGQADQTGNASSTRVEHEIKRALTRHGVTATHVTIAFSNGTATLSGTVYTQDDIAKAKRAALQVHGVTQVDDSGLHARKS